MSAEVRKHSRPRSILAKPDATHATCRVCGTSFLHPAPGTGGEWTCSYACRMGRPTTQRLFIPGHFPSLNEVIAAAKGHGGRGAGYAKMKREWTEIAWAEAKRAKLRPVERARLEFLWIEKDRRRDKDNIAAAKKFVIDSLVKAGVLPADGWSSVVGFTDDFEVEKRRHGVEITITEVP